MISGKKRLWRYDFNVGENLPSDAKANKDTNLTPPETEFCANNPNAE